MFLALGSHYTWCTSVGDSKGNTKTFVLGTETAINHIELWECELIDGSPKLEWQREEIRRCHGGYFAQLEVVEKIQEWPGRCP